MQTLHQALQKRLKQRKLYQQAIWLVIFEFLKPQALHPAQMKVTVRDGTCEIRLAPEENKPGRYMQKEQLLASLNAHLQAQGWEKKLTTLKIC